MYVFACTKELIQINRQYKIDKRNKEKEKKLVCEIVVSVYMLSNSYLSGMTVSPCSTTKSSGTTESSPAQTDNKGPDAFDASEVEEILTRQTTMDMVMNI